MEVWKANPKVLVKDSVLVKKKIQKLICDGSSQVHVVTDFDGTLSRSHINGRRAKSSFCVVESDPRILPEDMREEYNARAEKYLAIENDPKLTREEKVPHMVQWWTSTYRSLLKAGITDEHLRDIARKGEIQLRRGALDMLELLEANAIPCLVFSAGLGEIVTYTLEQSDALRPNVTVISNYFKFRDTPEGPKGEIPDDLLHTYNKNAQFPLARQYFATEKIRSRRNAILLGDSTGDSNMVDGAPGLSNEDPFDDSRTPSNGGASTILKIGFLNSNTEKRLKTFLELFDVVLLDDQTMDVPLNLLRDIIAGNQTI
ncbi:cytosolic 5'-nucleotidase 3-like [Tropilaelaps mercedesae]|uniref:5'-nucleotidase n=1 Tax=Tropilaelaps mercedesae TaxID=418985 RepID=A0A1V9X8B5_9ACAR|nr:cytosolic 5'-nucleotidase 3-like [Tropilaelaps mercedesae]